MHLVQRVTIGERRYIGGSPVDAQARALRRRVSRGAARKAKATAATSRPSGGARGLRRWSFPGKSAHASRERLHEAGRSAARGTERTRPASVALEGVDVKQTVCQPTDTPDRDRLVRQTRSPFVYFTAFSPAGARTGPGRGLGPAASAAEPGSTSAPRGFSFQRARRSI